jgi:hypothetical protein
MTSVAAHIEVSLVTDPPAAAWTPLVLGTEVVFAIAVTDLVTGATVEPSSVACRLIDPREGTERLGVTPVDFGVWNAIASPGLPGRWEYRVTCGGAAVGAVEGVFWMANSEFV